MYKISIIIPTYRGSEQIGRAIESVRRQTYSNYEIIIVDDNGINSDYAIKTKEIVSFFQKKGVTIKYIGHKTNKNGAHARNTGIKNASGDFITFLDDDDFLLPTRLEDSVNFLSKNQEYSGVYTDVLFMHGNIKTSYLSVDKDLTKRNIMIDNMAIGTGSNIFLRKECINSIGGFDVEFLRNQDIEFMVRLLRNHKIGFLNKLEIVKCQNLHPNMANYSKMKEIKKEFAQKFEKDINEMSNADIKLFNQSVAEVLFNVSFNGGNKEEMREAKDRLREYRPLNIKEIIKYHIRYIGLKYKKKSKALAFKVDQETYIDELFCFSIDK